MGIINISRKQKNVDETLNEEQNAVHVDGYRHWLHGRVDYLGDETYPGEISPWHQGNKVGHLFFIFLPVLCFWFVGNGYKTHLRQKNVKMNIIGVFSQDSI